MHTPLAMMLLDIDYFKNYNDCYGHLEGDKCLKKISDLIVQKMRKKGVTISRYGGEEIAIILPNTTNACAIELAVGVQDFIEMQKLPHVGSQHDHLKVVTVSIGVVSLHPKQSTSIGDVVERADKALYQVKANSRNHSLLFIEQQ